MKQQEYQKPQTPRHHSFPQIQLHPSISKKQIEKISQIRKFDIHFLTLVLYNYLQTPRMQEFLGVSLEAEGELCLVKKQLCTQINQNQNENDREYEYFLLYMVNENTPLEIDHSRERPYSQSEYKELKELKPILTTLISLSDKVVVYDIDKQKQAFIEKVYFDSITTCQKIKWQNPASRVQRLVFIRDCYDNENIKNQTKKQSNISANLTASTSVQTLQYYSSLTEYKQHIQQEKQQYLFYKREFQLINDRHFIDKLINQRQVVKKITLKEILHIYEKIMMMMTRPFEEIVLESLLSQFLGGNNKGSEKQINTNLQSNQGKVNLSQPWKVRYYIEKVYELESMTNLYEMLQRQIFYPETVKHTRQQVHKELIKYLSASVNHRITSYVFAHQSSLYRLSYIPSFLSQVSLSQSSKDKLLWKINRLHKYERQLAQEQKLSPLNSADKLLFELRDDEIAYWLEKYHKKWLEHSLTHLKNNFNKIANEKDHKSIQQFKQECYKMQERLNQLLKVKLFDQEKKDKLRKINFEVCNFVEYHNDVIQAKRFAGLRYFYKDAVYLLKHKENVRNKIALFILIILLAIMQKNVIAGLTIGTMALIVLAIRL